MCLQAQQRCFRYKAEERSLKVIKYEFGATMARLETALKTGHGEVGQEVNIEEAIDVLEPAEEPKSNALAICLDVSSTDQA